MLSTMCIQSVFEKIITGDSHKHVRVIHKISSVNNIVDSLLDEHEIHNPFSITIYEFHEIDQPNVS